MAHQFREEKAWNGGSVEEAMKLARQRNDELIAQGRHVLCDECNGDGGTIHGLCIQCHGAGVLPVSPPAEGEVQKLIDLLHEYAPCQIDPVNDLLNEAADLLTRLAAEIERLQEAKRRALTLADERAWEAAELRQALEKATGEG